MIVSKLQEQMQVLSQKQLNGKNNFISMKQITKNITENPVQIYPRKNHG